MSIYATYWSMKFEDPDVPDEWVEVMAQSVPPHIGSDECGDPFASFLPPPVPEDSKYARAVVFVAPWTVKGTERSGQEYRDPLLVITGQEYAEALFPDLLQRIWDAVQLQRERRRTAGQPP